MVLMQDCTQKESENLMSSMYLTPLQTSQMPKCTNEKVLDYPCILSHWVEMDLKVMWKTFLPVLLLLDTHSAINHEGYEGESIIFMFLCALYHAY